MVKSAPTRLLHTMLRVRDLEASLRFYTGLLGMTLRRRKEFDSGRFTLAFLGFGPEGDDSEIELTWNWDRSEPYETGNAFGHLALATDDIHGLCASLEAAGVPIPRPPGPMKHGGASIAFITDPDGYAIELIEV